MNRKFKREHLFEIQIFCSIINVFTVNFDHFNAYILNKSILCIIIIIYFTKMIYTKVHHGFVQIPCFPRRSCPTRSS